MGPTQSMKHELSILVQLKHSNIGSLWGYEEDTYGSLRMPAIVTEFYENGSLHEVCFVRSTTYPILSGMFTVPFTPLEGTR